ncbi:fibrocystin-L-like [Argopecten irradians]|uniref:fibrocystin-L-like n=1 Tax=Argopecten irradians TaxID=31199 RepID=UPI003711DA4B
MHSILFKAVPSYTPSITEITPLSGPQGTLLTMKGLVFTSKYGPNTRNINVSYALSSLGRSQSSKALYRVSRNSQISMFQSYAEIHSITPSSGSAEGGTIITISGRYFDETTSSAVVKVGGLVCNVLSLNTTSIKCRTFRKPDQTQQISPGNRGVIIESWKETSVSDLDMIKDLNESAPDYSVTFSDTTSITGDSTSGSYANRLRGFFYPPYDGEYHFFISSSNGCNFYLSTDTDPAETIVSSKNNRGGGGFVGNVSLQANESYHIEVFYRQSTISIWARWYNSVVNHHMAGNIEQHSQRITISSSTIQKEKQKLTIRRIGNGTIVYEQQEITMDQLEGSFRLGLYGVFTGNIKYSYMSWPGSFKDLARSVGEGQPEYQEKNTPTSYQYLATAIHGIRTRKPEGDFPTLEVIGLSEPSSVTIVTIQDGEPSGRKITLMMAGTPSPLIDSNSSASQLKDGLDGLFMVRCPSYWTNPKKAAVYYSMDDYSTLPLNFQNKWMDYNCWNYGCYNLLSHIMAVYPDFTNLVLRRLRIDHAEDFFVDEVYFGQQATTSDTDDAHLRRLVCSPNGYRIIDTDVTDTGDSYDITLTAAYAGHGFPLFEVDKNQVFVTIILNKKT